MNKVIVKNLTFELLKWSHFSDIEFLGQQFTIAEDACQLNEENTNEDCSIFESKRQRGPFFIEIDDN